MPSPKKRGQNFYKGDVNHGKIRKHQEYNQSN